MTLNPQKLVTFEESSTSFYKGQQLDELHSHPTKVQDNTKIFLRKRRNFGKCNTFIERPTRNVACSLDLSFGNHDLFKESSFEISQEKSNSRNFLKVATPRFETKNNGLDNVDRMMNSTMHY